MGTQPSIEQFIREAGSDALGRIVSDLADIAVIVGTDGVVVDVPHVREPAEILEPASWRGRHFRDTIAAGGRTAAGSLLARLSDGGPVSGEEVLHNGPHNGVMAIRYGGAPLRTGGDILLLGRALGAETPRGDIDFGTLFSAGANAHGHETALAGIVSHGSDLVVLLDGEGRMLWGNDAFHVGAQTSLVSAIEGRFLEDLVTWHDPVDLEVLLSRATEAGSSGPAAATLRGDGGTSVAVTVGLTRLPQTQTAIFGAIIRPMVLSDATPARDTGFPMAAIMDQAGHVPLKGLVRETADMVERHCLQAALRLSGNNRSAAARALGISRQALYQKLDRFGLGDD